jgi:crossover junction endodeoxyribonuclease RuvC
MFDRPILGIDPGVASLGLAVLAPRGAQMSVAWSGTLKTPSDMPEAERLERVHRAVTKAIQTHVPAEVAIERLAWNRNVTSGMAVARASGVVLLAAAQAGLTVTEYGSLQVKMAATGDGGASKEQVRDALRRFHKIDGVPEQADAADAVAVALCHLTGAAVRASAALAGAER